MKIRPATSPDERAVQALVSDVLLQFGYPTREREDLIDFVAYHPHGCFFVAEHEGTIVGCAGAERFGDDIKLRRMHVHKDFRRQGIGLQLLKAVFEWVDKNNIQAMYLSTDEHMTDAIAFYSSQEFIRISHLPNTIPGDSGDTVFFVKKRKRKK